MLFYQLLGSVLSHGRVGGVQRGDQEDRSPDGEFPASYCAQNQGDQGGKDIVKEISFIPIFVVLFSGLRY